MKKQIIDMDQPANLTNQPTSSSTASQFSSTNLSLSDLKDHSDEVQNIFLRMQKRKAEEEYMRYKYNIHNQHDSPQHSRRVDLYGSRYDDYMGFMTYKPRLYPARHRADLDHQDYSNHIDTLPTDLDMKKSTLTIELEDNVVGIHTIHPNIDNKRKNIALHRDPPYNDPLHIHIGHIDTEIHRRVPWIRSMINIDDDKYNIGTSVLNRLDEPDVEEPDEPDKEWPDVKEQDEPDKEWPDVEEPDEPDKEWPDVEEPDEQHTNINNMTGNLGGDNRVASYPVQQPKKNRRFIMLSEIEDLEEVLGNEHI